MKQITIMFEDNGNVKVNTGNTNLGDQLLAAKMIENNVSAFINTSNLEEALRKNMTTVMKVMKEHGYITELDRVEDRHKACDVNFEIDKYLVGKEVTVDGDKGIILNTSIMNGEIIIEVDFKHDESLVPPKIIFNNCYVTEFMDSPSEKVPTYLNDGNIVLAQTGYSDELGVSVAIYKANKNKVDEVKYITEKSKYIKEH